MKNLLDEIKNLTSSKQWSKLFLENKITEQEILENIEYILKSNSKNIIENMISMFNKNQRKIGVELFNIIIQKYYNSSNWVITVDDIFNIINIITPKNFDKWVNNLNDDELQKYKSILISYITKSLPKSIDVLNQLTKINYKVDDYLIQQMIESNKDKKDTDIQEFIQNWLNTELQPEMFKVVCTAIKFNVLTPQELVKIIKDSYRVIDILILYPDMVKSINEDKVLLNEFYNNLINNKNVKFGPSNIRNLKNIILDDELYNKLVDLKTTLVYKIQNNDTLDWNNFDSIIEDLNYTERKALFYRVDVPVWFLNKHHSVLLHLQMTANNHFNRF